VTFPPEPTVRLRLAVLIAGLIITSSLAVAAVAYVLLAIARTDRSNFEPQIAEWVSGRIVRPIAELTTAANRLADDRLDERLVEVGPDDELSRLRSPFNGMLDRLEVGFDARRRCASDATHELTTPLAVLRSKADNTLDDASVLPDSARLAADVFSQVDQTDRLLVARLALARVDEVDALDRCQAAGGEVGVAQWMATR